MQRTVIEDQCCLDFYYSLSSALHGGQRKEAKEGGTENALSFADPRCYNFSGDVTVKREKNNSARRAGATKAKREIG